MINPREFFHKIIRPQSDDEDIARRERILNVLLVSCAVLFFASFLISLSQYIVPGYRGLNPIFFLTIILWFGFLYLLSKRKKSRLASYLFLGSFSLLPTYAIFHWGADVIAGLLFYVLVIVMSGILIGNRASLATAGFAIFFITLTTYLQINKIVSPVSYWKSEPVEMADTMAVSIIFFVIAVVSWLSSSQIQKSLTRAKKSEADLKAERDSLEIKVEQRTQELKEAQAEKMIQLYRFAEFGRISSGLFHDLINPLNAVSLNLGKVNGAGEDGLPVRETKQYVDNAVHAAKKLEDLVVSVRRQLMRQESKAEFMIDEEIKQVLNVLSHKAQKANVQLRFERSSALNKSESSIRMFGDAIKFNQVVLNLVANGIEACLPSAAEGAQTTPEGWVLISLAEEPETITMIVQDNGMGIPESHMDKIFEPFFTTKGNGQGMGIGLSLAKRIVEKDFGGLLTAKSEIGKGSLFKASLPVPKITVYAT